MMELITKISDDHYTDLVTWQKILLLPYKSLQFSMVTSKVGEVVLQILELAWQ